MLCADRHDALPPAVACAGSCIVLNATAPATFRPEYCPRCRRAHACAVAGPGLHRDWRLPHLRRTDRCSIRVVRGHGSVVTCPRCNMLFRVATPDTTRRNLYKRHDTLRRAQARVGGDVPDGGMPLGWMHHGRPAASAADCAHAALQRRAAGVGRRAWIHDALHHARAARVRSGSMHANALWV